MAQCHVILRSGETRTMDLQTGLSLKDNLIMAGIDEINAITHCGGCCSCGTCHVILDDATAAHLPAPSEDENDLLDISPDRSPSSRLACQVRVSETLAGAQIRIGQEH